MKQAQYFLIVTAVLLLNLQTSAASHGMCESVHVPAIRSVGYFESMGSNRQRLSVPAFLKKFDELAARLKEKGELTSPISWRSLSAGIGLPSLDLPVEMGGKNLSASQMVQIFEHAGKYSLDLRDVVGGAHVRPLVQSSSPEVRAIVSQVASGKGYMAIAITERDVGTHMRAMKSVSEKVDGGYLLTGEKMYNARFTTASHVIIFTQASADPASKGKLNAFVLPTNDPGLNFTQLNARGLHGNSFGGVSFNKLFVPEKFRIGGHGQGGKVFRHHFLYWRLMMAAAAVGTGKGALEQVVERLRTREAFGGPIGRFTHLQQPLGEYTAKLKMASLLVQEAAKKLDQGKYEEAAALVAMAKGEGVEIALAASDYAMRTFGAAGYTDVFDLSQRVADLQGLRIADGTTDVMRQEVVRLIYGDDLWDMAVGTPE